jgi:hypothetical protein
MKVKTSKFLAIFLATLVAGVFAASSAFAIPSLPENWKIKFENFENFDVPVDANGNFILGDGVEDNWGIFRITTITDRLAGVDTYTSASNYQLTGIFYNLDISAISPNAGGGFDVNFVGGSFDVYAQDKTAGGFTAFDPSLGPGGRNAVDDYTNVTDGIRLLHANFVPGIIPGDGTTTNHSVVTATTLPLTGHGSGYLDVIPGTGIWSDVISPQTGDQDVLVEFDVRTHPDSGLPNYGWDLNSEDPAFGNAVPEPATMLLLGTGLLGLAGLTRRRKRS